MQRPGDGIRAADQIAHETLEIVDQPSLVSDQCGCVGLLQFQTTCHSSHERLGVFGEALKHSHQVA